MPGSICSVIATSVWNGLNLNFKFSNSSNKTEKDASLRNDEINRIESTKYKYGYPIKTDVICNYETDYANEISHKLNYEYKILFGYEETFNNMDLGRSVFNYSNENKDIQVNYSDINNKNKYDRIWKNFMLLISFN